MKTMVLKHSIFWSLLIFGFCTFAQSQAEREQSRTHVIKSEITGKSYELMLSLPASYSEEGDKEYPVLYYLDGEMMYHSFQGARTLLDFSQEIESMIIVGITSKTNVIGWWDSRWEDFTPSTDVQADSLYGIRGSSGGAEDFLSVLRREVIPFVESKYRTTEDRGIAGHSLAALFVTYCLFEATDLFQRFGINSPSLWWNDEEIFRKEGDFNKDRPDLNARVFISVGELEEADMVPPTISLSYLLANRGYEGLNLTWHVFEDEGHVSVVPAAISRTLRALYGNESH